MPTSAASGEDHLNRGLAPGSLGGGVRTAAVGIVAEVYRCSDTRARELLAALSQCHHLKIGVLSTALVEVVNHGAQARNPPTGDMVVACALWRRELTPLTGNVHHPTLPDAVARLPGRG